MPAVAEMLEDLDVPAKEGVPGMLELPATPAVVDMPEVPALSEGRELIGR